MLTVTVLYIYMTTYRSHKGFDHEHRLSKHIFYIIFSSMTSLVNSRSSKCPPARPHTFYPLTINILRNFCMITTIPDLTYFNMSFDKQKFAYINQHQIHFCKLSKQCQS